jgi:hypothetical protein
LVVVIYTSSPLMGRFYIMTMTMKELEVLEFILTALRAGDFMVDFQQIPVFEEQMAADAFSLLSFE